MNFNEGNGFINFGKTHVLFAYKKYLFVTQFIIPLRQNICKDIENILVKKISHAFCVQTLYIFISNKILLNYIICLRQPAYPPPCCTYPALLDAARVGAVDDVDEAV